STGCSSSPTGRTANAISARFVGGFFRAACARKRSARPPPTRLRERAFYPQALRSGDSGVPKVPRRVPRAPWPCECLFFARRMLSESQPSIERSHKFPESAQRLQRQRICWTGGIRPRGDSFYAERLFRGPFAFSSVRCKIEGICCCAFRALFRCAFPRGSWPQG